jgi:hypothetical protein
MEAVRFFEMPENFNWTTRRHALEENTIRSYYCCLWPPTSLQVEPSPALPLTCCNWRVKEVTRLTWVFVFMCTEKFAWILDFVKLMSEFVPKYFLQQHILKRLEYWFIQYRKNVTLNDCQSLDKLSLSAIFQLLFELLAMVIDTITTQCRLGFLSTYNIITCFNRHQSRFIHSRPYFHITPVSYTNMILLYNILIVVGRFKPKN